MKGNRMQSEENAKSIHIAFVDDNPIVLSHFQVLCCALPSLQVSVFLSAKDVIAFLSNNQVDVLILDIDMPDMDGVSLLKVLGEQHHHIPLALCSGLEKELLSGVKAYAKTQALCVLDILDKPVSQESLLNLINLLQSDSLHYPKTKTINSASISVSDLAHAITMKEFYLAIQPKVVLSSKAVIGGELLARWRRSDEVLVGPGQFIPLLEQSGMMDRFSMLVVSEAFDVLYHNKAQFETLNVSINLSVGNFNDESILEYIYQCLSDVGISSGSITFEVTESILIEDLAVCLEKLLRLRVAGFKLSIDDFGTGFSTLKQLQDLPFTELKIDRCFVSDCHLNEKNQSIIRSLVKLASELNLSVVAEGVECKAEADCLESMGIEFAQGYFFARPMSIAEFLQHIARNPTCG
ncbi:hypothetical protein PALB_18750 [Pseudoalteromonas luteoviolacea B = ATCC 29581]|nr:hypothetical protein PALB_18750 [Pseudoalteromonas luteoviolacea B = ATCC 29581]